MDQITNYVLTMPIEKNMIFTIFFSPKLTFVLRFSSTPLCLGIFPTQIHMPYSSQNWNM
jgi:hypothetical protein